MVATAFVTPSISPRQHKLRTYVVLNAKSSRGRLASLSDLIDDAAKLTSAREAAIPDECLAYESYAAVASRFQSSPSTSLTRDLRWSDISRANLSPLATTRKTLPRRARLASSGAPNSHVESYALELSFEFLELCDLQSAAASCAAFRTAVTSSGRLVTAMYARQWRGRVVPSAECPAPASVMPRAYAALDFATALAMLQQRRADFAYALTTRSQLTKRADATVELLNNSLLRAATRGAVDSARGTAPLPMLPCALALGHRVSYFEVAMTGCGSVGLVSLSDAATRRAYGYGSAEHVGWTGVAVGFHGNDGDFVFNDGAAPHGGEWAPYGPAWGAHHRQELGSAAATVTATATVGCGLDERTRRVFFTLDGAFLGFAPFAVPAGGFAAAVSLHEFNDRAVLNAGSAPFRFDVEGFCASL